VPVGRGAGCTESTDPNEVRARAMDGPSHEFARSEFGHAQHARRALHREVQRQSTTLHADFQSGVHRLLALYFNKLPGRPLPNLHDCA